MTIYNDALKDKDGLSISLLALLNAHFRFRIINYKNSQSSYLGMWVMKQVKSSEFELLHKRYRNCPYQLIQRGIIIPNHYRNHLKHLIDNYPEELCDPCQDAYCELF
jgi:hypothetical protein